MGSGLRNAIAAGVLFLVIAAAGCGGPGRAGNNADGLAVSHRQAVETAVRRVLSGFRIPSGGGSVIAVAVEGGREAADVIRPVAVEDMTARGWVVAGNAAAPRTMTVTVDTLAVTLTDGDRGHVRRRVETRLSVAITGDDGSRAVFSGGGEHDDAVPRAVFTGEEGLPFVEDRTGEGRLLTKLKPMIIGVAMTVIAWTLYSYRG